MDIISFSLYGKDTRYTDNAIINADLMAKIYPDWLMFVYYDHTVPTNIVKQLQTYKMVRLINMDKSEIKNKMLWRFLPMSDKRVNRFLVRDIDSHISIREKLCVNEWIKSGKTYHIIRDHPSHGHYPMSGGMWGGKVNGELDLKKILTNYNQQVYRLDMDLLNRELWPKIRLNVLQHDSFPNNRYGITHPFPTERKGYEHVGSVIINGELRDCDVKILKKAMFFKSRFSEC